MFQIITNTPLWVFVLFFFLLALGLMQVKDREITFKKAMILPFVMLFLSFLGLLSAFGITFYSLSFWLLGICLGVYLNILLKFPRNSIFNKNENLFFIKGSFIPLFLIMSIFFTKYFVGVVTAMQLEFLTQIWFIFIISFLYGLFSGMFFGRFFVLKALK